MAEFYSANHHEPLIVLPRANLMYFPSNLSICYNIRPRKASTTSLYDRMLETICTQGGDFRLQPMASGRMVFQLFDSNRDETLACTAWNFAWVPFVRALLKIQRFVRHMRMTNWFRPANILALKAFVQSDAGNRLPKDVLFTIIHACIHTSTRNFHCKAPISRFETNSFQKIARVQREKLIV